MNGLSSICALKGEKYDTIREALTTEEDKDIAIDFLLNHIGGLAGKVNHKDQEIVDIQYELKRKLLFNFINNKFFLYNF